MPKGLKAWRKKNRKRYIGMMTKQNELDVYFYMVKLFDENEHFIKIGISVDLDQRMNNIPYEHKILIKESMRIDKAYDFESSCIDMLYQKKLSYNPKKQFGGSTECFKTAAVIVLQKTFTKKGFVRID